MAFNCDLNTPSPRGSTRATSLSRSSWAWWYLCCWKCNRERFKSTTQFSTSSKLEDSANSSSFVRRVEELSDEATSLEFFVQRIIEIRDMLIFGENINNLGNEFNRDTLTNCGGPSDRSVVWIGVGQVYRGHCRCFHLWLRQKFHLREFDRLRELFRNLLHR